MGSALSDGVATAACCVSRDVEREQACRHEGNSAFKQVQPLTEIRAEKFILATSSRTARGGGGRLAWCCRRQRPSVQLPPLTLATAAARSASKSPPSPLRRAGDSSPWTPSADPLETEWRAAERQLSAAEFARLREFRERVAMRGLDSHAACAVTPHSKRAATLLRFMRARPRMEAAVQMLSDALDWRRDFDIDRKVEAWRAEWAIGTSPRARLLKRYGYVKLLGLDREGMPAWLHRPSSTDFGGIIREVGMDALLVHLAMFVEASFAAAQARIARTGQLPNAFVEIHDLGNYGLVPQIVQRGFAALPFFKRFAPIFDKVYPERVRVVYMIRTPQVFWMIWNIMLPLVPENTRMKLRFYGFQASSWLQDMEEELPGAILPDWLRGEDPANFAVALPKGGIVPKGALRAMEMGADDEAIN
eukprot:TRINITY_DN29252_c0_g1_i1.p1 TRINITY_DN29252_c0_g1~~TRINITY_DN29252_c0_g1_i1.p1  ORF type:complete len:433 (-),score=79.77 TRINITY_DN29252_c0_g1_i1:24-1280(-)